MNGRVQGAPLTVFWRLMITLAAVVGVGTCAVLGLLYMRFAMTVPGTVDVLERQLTGQDAVPAIQDEDGEARLGESRFLAAYESMSYYAAPGPLPGVVCLVGKYPYDDEYNYWEACNGLGDGRDILVEVPDPDNRTVILVPDQFDHGPLERDGWVTLHRNLLVHPLGETALEPAGPLIRSARHGVAGVSE
ncbi:hypothetical protein ACFYLX_18770 [Pseudarthrobacter enclensis]|jgi:hypothetical protein|uniref:hypothetical protein n=1 Tax=Pseudarthrobacter enclensis TaxID=993070 RepID=UPI00368E70A8